MKYFQDSVCLIRELFKNAALSLANRVLAEIHFKVVNTRRY